MNEEYIKLNLGQIIKKYRNKLGLTQDDLAEKIGRTQRQVSLIELGKSYPNPETLSNIATSLNCSLKDLFDFEPITNIENLKNELCRIIETMPEDKLKTLYIVGKNI